MVSGFIHSFMPDDGIYIQPLIEIALCTNRFLKTHLFIRNLILILVEVLNWRTSIIIDKLVAICDDKKILTGYSKWGDNEY